jgi:predicted Zn-dependent protease
VLARSVDQLANPLQQEGLQQVLAQLRAMERPSDLQIYQLASVETRIGSLERARALFIELCGRTKFAAGAFFHLGEIAMAQGRRQAAVTAYRRCLEIAPRHRAAARRLTSVLLDRRRTSTLEHSVKER